MRTVKDTMTIKELFWALQSLRCSTALNKECEQAVQVCHLLLANFLSVANITYPVEVIKWSHDVSELNECAMALREEVGLSRENARLFNAAPELLQACQEFVEHIKSLGTDTEKCRYLSMALNCRAGDLIEQAIAKATGGRE